MSLTVGPSGYPFCCLSPIQLSLIENFPPLLLAAFLRKDVFLQRERQMSLQLRKSRRSLLKFSFKVRISLRIGLNYLNHFFPPSSLGSDPFSFPLSEWELSFITRFLQRVPLSSPNLVPLALSPIHPPPPHGGHKTQTGWLRKGLFLGRFLGHSAQRVGTKEEKSLIRSSQSFFSRLFPRGLFTPAAASVCPPLRPALMKI